MPPPTLPSFQTVHYHPVLALVLSGDEVCLAWTSKPQGILPWCHSQSKA